MSTNEKKNKYFTFTNHDDIYIDYPMRLVEGALKDFHIENEEGEPISEYFVGDNIILVVEIDEPDKEVTFLLDTNATFVVSAGEQIYGNPKLKLKGCTGKLKLTVKKEAYHPNNMPKLIKAMFRGRTYEKEAVCIERKGFGVNYVRIYPNNVQKPNYISNNPNIPNEFIDTRGLYYKIWIYDNDGNIEEKPFKFFPRNKKKAGVVSVDYGLYSGPTCLTKLDEKGKYLPRKVENFDYSIPAVDDVDEGARLHDIGYDSVKAEGEDALDECWACLPADIKAMKDWAIVMAKKKKGINDSITKRPITDDEYDQAKNGALYFMYKINIKKKEVSDWIIKHHPNEASDGKSSEDDDIEANYKIFLEKYMQKEGDFYKTKDGEVIKWKYNKEKKYPYLKE